MYVKILSSDGEHSHSETTRTSYSDTFDPMTDEIATVLAFFRAFEYKIDQSIQFSTGVLSEQGPPGRAESSRLAADGENARRVRTGRRLSLRGRANRMDDGRCAR